MSLLAIVAVKIGGFWGGWGREEKIEGTGSVFTQTMIINFKIKVCFKCQPSTNPKNYQ